MQRTRGVRCWYPISMLGSTRAASESTRFRNNSVARQRIPLDAVLLERGTGNALGIELWRLPDGRFSILHLGSANPQSFSHMVHADREFLRLFYENTNGPTTWTGVSSTSAG